MTAKQAILKLSLMWKNKYAYCKKIKGDGIYMGYQALIYNSLFTSEYPRNFQSS